MRRPRRGRPRGCVGRDGERGAESVDEGERRRAGTAEQAPTIALLDGHSLAHRAFYALPPLSTSSGQPTHAVTGFLNMLLRL
ncbi:MAG: hypothetical protein K6U79_09005, partial [Firmicutes bacterium]|nr:hypothetical protein [Bacillota bacterium]